MTDRELKEFPPSSQEVLADMIYGCQNWSDATLLTMQLWPHLSCVPAQGARDAEYERKLFAAITKIDLATAVGHIRNWTCYIDDHHRQKYADLIEAQAKLIAHLVNTRAPSHTEGSRRCPDISNDGAWDVFAHARDAILARGGSERQGELAGLHAAIIAAYDVMTPSQHPSTDRGSAA